MLGHINRKWFFFLGHVVQQKACVYRISMSVYNDSVLFLALPVCVRGLLRVGLLLPVLAQHCYLFIYTYIVVCVFCFVSLYSSAKLNGENEGG